MFSSCCAESEVTQGSWWHDPDHREAIAATDLYIADSAVGSLAWPQGVCASFVAFGIASRSATNVTEHELHFGWEMCGSGYVDPPPAGGYVDAAARAAAVAAAGAERTPQVRAAYLDFERSLVGFCRNNKLLLLAAAIGTAVAALFSFACNIYLMCYWKPDPKQTVAQAMSMLASALQQDMGRGMAAVTAGAAEDESARRERHKRKKERRRRRRSSAGGGGMI